MGKKTIKDIARMAGVSPATVSRVINKVPEGVGDATRKRVQAIIERENFTPSAFARGLVLRKSRIIGFIVPDTASEFYQVMAKGIEDCASEHGYNLVLCDGQNNHEKEAGYILFLDEHQVSGLVHINVMGTRDSTIDLIEKRGIPTVYVDTKVDFPNACNVHMDNNEATKELVRYVCGMGHRKIAFIGGFPGSAPTRNRFEGYKSVLEEEGIPLDSTLVIDADYTLEGGEKAFRELLARGKDFTAVVCCNDLMAAGVYLEMERQGLEVGRDISVTGFDNLKWTLLMHPKLTTVSQPFYEMGRRGAKALIVLMEGRGEPDNREIVLGSEFVIRDSVWKVD